MLFDWTLNIFSSTHPLEPESKVLHLVYNWCHLECLYKKFVFSFDSEVSDNSSHKDMLKSDIGRLKVN